MNLLIIDDLPINRKLLRAQLTAGGHVVLEAADGIEALELLERENVDGVVSDILMPNMDGYRLCLEIRKSPKFGRVPFVFYTSTYKSAQDQQLAQTVGADGYLVKPCATHLILEALDKAVQKSRAGITAPAAGTDEGYVLKQYSATLVRKLEEKNLELETANAQLQNLSRIHSVISGVNMLIVHADSRQRMFDEACRIAVNQGGFGMAWVSQLDPKTLDVTPVAHAGNSSEGVVGLKTSARADIALGQGVVGRAIRARTAVYINDLTAEPDAGSGKRREAIRLGYRSLIALPLQTEDSVFGTLTLYATEPKFFNKEELDLLTRLAENISFGLEHINQLQNIAKLSRTRLVTSEINAAIVRTQNPQELFREVCRIAIEHGYFGLAWIGALDSSTQEITPVSWAGYGTDEIFRKSISTRADESQSYSLVGRAIRERRPQFSNDLSIETSVGSERRLRSLELGFRSSIYLPLYSGMEVAGIMVLLVKEISFFDKDELTLLSELAGNISFALEHMARQQKIAKLTRIRTVLGEINAAIVRIEDKQALFDESCRIAADAGRFHFAWIGIYDRDRKQVRPVAWANSTGKRDEMIQKPRDVDTANMHQHGSVAMAMLERKPVIVNEVRNDLRVINRDAHLARGTHALAVFPLFVSDEVIGVLMLHSSEPGFFDEEEVKLLSELSGDIGFAIQTIEKQQQLDYLSYFDVITGLPNRRLFIDRISQRLRGQGDEPGKVALIMLNIERFRNVNETFGRRGGDRILVLVAQRLEAAFGGKDFIARVGADDFVVAVPDIQDTAAASNVVCIQSLDCFREPYEVDGFDMRISARIGIAISPADGMDADTLYKNAEAALKKARESGERCMFYSAELNARATHFLSLETRLVKAVEAQQFVLHYQPKIDFATNTICGMEALIRWQDPDRGLVAPGSFIPMLEETGLILEVGKWALEQALSDYNRWKKCGYAVPRVAVNVSAIQLRQKNFLGTIIDAVQRAGDIPDALELEITESLLMQNFETNSRFLSTLRGMGIQIAMDDFGTGYSSLNYLSQLPLDVLKIDRSFISKITASKKDLAIVSAIIRLAHSLELRVVAEGVEEEEQSKLLMSMKCNEAQGYLFSKPLPAQQMESLLSSQNNQTAEIN